MSNLHRELAPVTREAWAQIEDEARRTFSRHVAGRRVVDVTDPGGPGLAGVGTGHLHELEAHVDGVQVRLREIQPLIEVRVPFLVTRQAVDDVERGAQDSDWQPVKDAARRIAFAEDRAIIDGLAPAHIEGIRPGSSNSPRHLPADVRELPDVVSQALSALRLAGVGGPYSLLLSADDYTAVAETTVQGYPVLRHVEELLDVRDADGERGRVIWAPAITGGLLISTRGGDYELNLGDDLSIGYSSHDAEHVELYLLESFTARVLTTEASVALEAALTS